MITIRIRNRIRNRVQSLLDRFRATKTHQEPEGMEITKKELRWMVGQLIDKYKDKLNIKQKDIGVKFMTDPKKGPSELDYKAKLPATRHGKIKRDVNIVIGYRLFKFMFETDYNTTYKVLENSVAHELAHLKVIEDLGVVQAKMVGGGREEEILRLTEQVTGYTTDEVVRMLDSVLDQMGQKKEDELYFGWKE